MNDFDYEDLHYDNIGTRYGIAIEEERWLWETQYIKKYLYVPNTCPQCGIGKVFTYKFESVLNPLKGACSKKNCKYRFFLRKYSIFGNFPKIPVQILMYIIEQFIIEKKMLH